MSKVFVVGALPVSLLNFRKELMLSLIERGHTVIAMASGADKNIITELKNIGVNYIDYPVSRNGLNPIEDIKTFFSLLKVFRNHNPDTVLAYTIKPVIWASFAARFARVNSIFALITGLGFAFQRGGFKRNLLSTVVKKLYKQALKKSSGVIFQNPDNKKEFTDNELVCAKKCHLVNGSGVDLKYYKLKPFHHSPQFLLVARMLGEKGVREYLSAAKIVKQKFPAATFDLVGPEDPSPDGISASEIMKWQEDKIIHYHGGTADVRPFIEKCSIFVLPSYHEGLPRTVLEAMAMGRPILTTNVPGCRETVINGVNGWLVEKANTEQLAERMIWFIENQDAWQDMANESHRIAKNKFDVHKVNEKLIKIMGL